MGSQDVSARGRCSPLGAARCPPSAEAPGAVRAGGSQKSPFWSARSRIRPALA